MARTTARKIERYLEADRTVRALEQAIRDDGETGARSHALGEAKVERRLAYGDLRGGELGQLQRAQRASSSSTTSGPGPVRQARSQPGGSTMKRSVMLLVGVALFVGAIASASAEGRPPQQCTVAVIDALEGFNMLDEATGRVKPRLYDGQVLRFIMAAEDGANFDVPSATPEADLTVDFLTHVLCDGLDPLVKPVCPKTPAPAPPPAKAGPVWYGGDPGIYIR